MTKIKVGVRARPLTSKEKESGDEVIIEISGNGFILKNQAVGLRDCEQQSKGRHFVYDYCFWSVDSWHPLYASQESIYKSVGVPVINSLLEGYNACIFAYGQSGTGKTYTVTGNDWDEGLLPRLCSDLFKKIHQIANSTTSIVEVSFIELYKERVRDILNFNEANENLRVREHPQIGPFVEGLTRHTVNNVNDVMLLIEKSKKQYLHKEILKRSHSIFTIRCLQESNCAGTKCFLSSELHLVDLAGSERSPPVDDFNDHIERININKSLVTLGIVISALANQFERTIKPSYVPFRNSVLTWLLKETLGGNCITCMIATVSPASSCYKETLNTLRYAQSAASIRNKPIINATSKIHNLVAEMKSDSEIVKDQLSSSIFKQGFILENIISPYRDVSLVASKPTDAFNPFINKNYFEKLVDDTGDYLETNNSSLSNQPTLPPNMVLSNSDKPTSTTTTQGDEPRTTADNNILAPFDSPNGSIKIKFKRQRAKSKSCENIACEVLPLWKRFSRSLQDRERMENRKTVKERHELLKEIEPLPLTVLKLFKNQIHQESVADLDKLDYETEDNFKMIEEETDSMLGSWCSMSSSGHYQGDICFVPSPILEVSDEITPPSRSGSQDGLNLVRVLANQECVGIMTSTNLISRSAKTELSQSVCSNAESDSCTYNDSLNTPRNTPSEVEDNGLTESTPSGGRRQSNYSTDSVEGHNNVTSSESLSYQEVEKCRRTYINYVTNTSTLQFSKITDERKVPFTLIRDPGTPDSGFVSTRVFPNARNSLWPCKDTTQNVADGHESSSSSDSITFVFVDQSLSKNSRNNSEERSSAESTTAPEINSVIELPRANEVSGDSIVTLDSLEVWKDERPGANSPRALSVDSLVMEQYLKLINESNPPEKPPAQSVRKKIPQRKTSSTSESSDSSKRGKKYDTDLVKLMSDVVQLLKNKQSRESCKNKCENCHAPKYSVATPSSSDNSDVSVVQPRWSGRRRDSVLSTTTSSDKTDRKYDGSRDTVDDEYRRVVKDSLKKEIRMIRKERDSVYRLLQKEKRKNSSKAFNKIAGSVKSKNGGQMVKLVETNSSSLAGASSSSSSSSSRGVIKTDFSSSRKHREDNVPRLPHLSQQLLESRKEIVVKEGNRVVLKERQQINPRQNLSQEERHSTTRHSKSTNVSRDLHDSGVVDCYSGYFVNSFNDSTDRQPSSLDKSVQTLALTKQEPARLSNKLTSSPKHSSSVASWMKPGSSQLTQVRPSYPSYMNSDLKALDDILGFDVYLDLPDEFNQTESFAIPFPSRFC